MLQELDWIEEQFRKLLEPLAWNVFIRPEDDPRKNEGATMAIFSFYRKDGGMKYEYCVAIVSTDIDHMLHRDRRGCDRLVRHHVEKLCAEFFNVLEKADPPRKPEVVK